MKTIPFKEFARDVWHDASVEVPDDCRVVLRIGIANNITTAFYTQAGWSVIGYATHWRELPAPPTPAPKIIPHSLAHWHDAKTTRPEAGRPLLVLYLDGSHAVFRRLDDVTWRLADMWTYAPENAQ